MSSQALDADGLVSTDSLASDHLLFCADFRNRQPIVGDLNGDGVVDVSDLLILLADWGPCPRSGDCPADLNGDGAVDVSDLLILLVNSIACKTEASSGGVVYTDIGHTRIVNCSFTRNNAVRGGAARNTATGTATIANSILWANTLNELFGPNFGVSYSNVAGG